MKTILNDVRVLKEEAQKAFESVANEFHNELYNRTPVDTGVAQKSWHIRVKNIQKFKFIVGSNVKYMPILWRGRKIVNGKVYGSLKGWGALGGQVLLDKYEVELRDKFRDILL